MNFKNTWLWMLAAAALFAIIYFFRPAPPEKPATLLPSLQASAVTRIEIRPAGEREITVERTNGLWRLVQPLNYPAETPRVEMLLAALEKLVPSRVISEQDLKTYPHADRDFGFESRQFFLTIEQGDSQSQLVIGARTAVGDEVYVQVFDGRVYVVDADLLQLLPRTVDQWRESSLVDLRRLNFDDLVVSNGGRVLELRRDSTNQLWRMLSPISIRADNRRVGAALKALQGLRVAQFVSDDPKADLDVYGLQTPEVSLAFRQDTNNVLLLEFGKSWTNNPNLVYARRGDLTNVVMVPRDSFKPWLASQSDYFRDFFDRHLLALTAVPDLIEVTQSTGEHFQLMQGTNHAWRILPDAMPADSFLVGELLTNLCNSEFPGIAQDVVTDSGFVDFGLAPPAFRIQLVRFQNPGEGLTNTLDFGVHEGKMYGRRDGERMVYEVDGAVFSRLQQQVAGGWKLRDLRIWNFSEDDVTNLVIRQTGKIREITHTRNGTTNIWSLAPGSQGIINDAAVEDAVHQFGELRAETWVQRGALERARFGFSTNDYEIVIGLRTGPPLTVELGGIAPSGFPYAVTELDRQPWVFEFPIHLFVSIQIYLTVP